MKYIDADCLRAEIENLIKKYSSVEAKGPILEGYKGGRLIGYRDAINKLNSLQKEQSEIDLEKFTEKMDAWKARYNYPDNISIKATMAFTARMFYQYPNIARQWYDSLSKTTMD